MYRYCFECGTSWDNPGALLADYDTVMKSVWPGIPDATIEPDAIFSCPRCGHDW